MNKKIADSVIILGMGSAGLLLIFLWAYSMGVSNGRDYERQEREGEHDSVEVMGVDWRPYHAQALMHYWYADHHCPCHRRQDAESVGYVAQDEDYEPGVPRDECGAIWFKIRRIWAPSLPDLILYSETLTETELYARLGGKL